MKFFMSFLLLFYLTTGYSYTPEEYIEVCKKNPMDKHSACYGYFQAVIDSMYVDGSILSTCFNKSDKEIFTTAMNGVTDFAKKHPTVDIFSAATIIRKTFQKQFPCKTNR